MWEENANYIVDAFGGYVDWEARYYLCPECGEPIYEDDWSEKDLKDFICPVCDFNDED
jgi:predicted RNA-binding Zn-ribbon protein involved in translation (DUF1610 family)